MNAVVKADHPSTTTLPRRRRTIATTLLVATFCLTGLACGGDSSDDADEPSTTSTIAAPAADEPGDSGDDSGDGGTGDAEEALTSEDICSALATDAVASATGLEITGAEPSTSSTPQCAYTFTSPNGPDSNLTVAATRITSSDAQTIEEAFDSAVQINVTTAGGTDVEQTDVDAGDEATLISGIALDLGVLRVGDVLVTLIVPPDAMTPDQANGLLVTVGDAFA